MCSSTILETGRSRSSCVLTSTSTKLPGSAKPATPTTSLTLTVMARRPCAMTDDSPPWVPTGASRDSSTGSSLSNWLRTTRPSSLSTRSKEPAGTAPAGQAISRNIDALSG